MLILATVAAVSRSGVPLYDGVNFPDAPYRFAGRSPAPTMGTVDVAVDAGRSAAAYLTTGENGPQLVVQLRAGALSTSASTIQVAGQPLAADGAPPVGTFDSNIYRLSAPGAQLAASGFIELRAAVMTAPAPQVIYRSGPGTPWRVLKTETSGRDILQAPLPGLGDFALQRLPRSAPLSAASGRQGLLFLLTLSAGGAVLLAGAVLLRRKDDTDVPTGPRPTRVAR